MKKLSFFLALCTNLAAMEIQKEQAKKELPILKIVESQDYEQALNELKNHIIEYLDAKPDVVKTALFILSEALDGSIDPSAKEIKKKLADVLQQPEKWVEINSGTPSIPLEELRSHFTEIQDTVTHLFKENNNYLIGVFREQFDKVYDCYLSFNKELAHTPQEFQEILKPKAGLCLEGEDKPEFFLIRQEDVLTLANLDKNMMRLSMLPAGQNHHTSKSRSGRVYFKCTDGKDIPNPEYEAAVYCLYSLLFPEIQVISPSCGFVCTGVGPKSETFYFQANTAIEGETLAWYLEKGTIEEINLESFSALVVGSFLINPHDWKPQNFIVRRDGRIVGIDNDGAFGPSIIQLGTGAHMTGIKNVLLLISKLMNKHIHEGVVKAIRKWKPLEIIDTWLHFLQKKQSVYEAIRKYAYPKNFDPEKAQEGLPQPNTPPALLIEFQPSCVHHLYSSCQKILSLIKPEVTNQQLFIKMQELVSDYYTAMLKNNYGNIGKAYLCLSEKSPSLEEAMDLNKRVHNGRKVFEVLSKENGWMKSAARVNDLLDTFKKLRAEHKNHEEKIEQDSEVEKKWKTILDKIFPLPPAEGKECIVSWGNRAKRYLAQNYCEQLWDSAGNFKPKNCRLNAKKCTIQSCQHIPWGRCEVSWIEIDGTKIWFKRFPKMAGFEKAVSNLMKFLLEYGLLYNELVWVNDACYLVSLDVEGENLQKIFDTTPEDTNPECLNNLDPKEISELILTMIMLAPEDGKPDNFQVQKVKEKFKLVCIDNENSFFPAYIKERDLQRKETGNLIRGIKSIIFCLDQMNDVVHEEVRTKFLTIEPFTTLTRWLRNCEGYHNVLTHRYTREMIQQCDKNECYVGVPFAPGMLTRIYKKYCLLREKLLENPKVTHIDLLLELYPGLQVYKSAFPRKKTVYGRFELVDGPLYNKQRNGVYYSQAKDFLESQNIVFETLTDAIKAHNELNPTHALEELAALQKTDSRRQNDFDKMDTLAKEEWLHSTNFLEKTESEQENLFDRTAFNNTAWADKFILKNAYSFKPDYFKNLKLSNVTKIDLTGCKNLTDESIPKLEECIMLEKLNLSKIHGLTKLLRKKTLFGTYALKLPNLIELKLNDNKEMQDVALDTPQLTRIFAKDCTKLVTLKTSSAVLKLLDLENCCSISNPEFEIILAASPLLSTVNLTGCSLIKYPTIREADLQFPVQILTGLSASISNCIKNAFDKRGSAAILELSHDPKIKSKEFRELCEKLKNGALASYIKELHLGDNDIDDEGIKSLADLLRSNTNLQNLHLGNTPCTVEGIVKLHEALLSNTTLKNIEYNTAAKKKINDQSLWQ